VEGRAGNVPKKGMSDKKREVESVKAKREERKEKEDKTRQDKRREEKRREEKPTCRDLLQPA
jgi:hypothetical protein